MRAGAETLRVGAGWSRSLGRAVPRLSDLSPRLPVSAPDAERGAVGQERAEGRGLSRPRGPWAPVMSALCRPV